MHARYSWSPVLASPEPCDTLTAMPNPDHDRPDETDSRRARSALRNHIAFLEAVAASEEVPISERLRAIELLAVIAGASEPDGASREHGKPHERDGDKASEPRRHHAKHAAKKHGGRKHGDHPAGKHAAKKIAGKALGAPRSGPSEPKRLARGDAARVGAGRGRRLLGSGE